MKIVAPILALLILPACKSSAFKNGPVAAKPNPTVNNYNVSNSSSTPNDVSKVDQAKQNESASQNERFKIAPEEFKHIAFKNYSYPYKFSYRRKLNIALNNGEHEYDFKDDRGWFNLSDVYYLDLTNDGHPEGIVLLWHVSCGVSCDGGAGLLYIYTAHQNKLKSLWQYETGSLADGCGLKSFTVKHRNITVELFGRCFDRREESVGGKFQVKDTTSLSFGFNGRKFVEEKKEYISVPLRSVMNHKPEISISE
jgi:hypothetical protein